MFVRLWLQEKNVYEQQNVVKLDIFVAKLLAMVAISELDVAIGVLCIERGSSLATFDADHWVAVEELVMY